MKVGAEGLFYTMQLTVHAKFLVHFISLSLAKALDRNHQDYIFVIM